jgi:hypothetical protein
MGGVSHLKPKNFKVAKIRPTFLKTSAIIFATLANHAGLRALMHR